MKTRHIRIYFPDFPYPPQGGSPQVVFDQVCTLSSQGHSVELVTWKNSQEEMERRLRAEEIQPFPKNVRLTVLEGHTSESGGERLIRVIRSFFSELSSPELLFYPKKEGTVRSADIADLGIYHYSFAYPWLKQPIFREKKRVVVFHNLESELFRERAETASNPLTSWIHRRNAQKLQDHEQELKELADEIWFISPEDYQNYGGGDIPRNSRLVPPGFSEKIYAQRTQRFLGQSGLSKKGPVLGFIGNLDFFPNHQSVQWLIRELAPLLKQRGFSGELMIAGKNASPALVQEAKSFEFVRFAGFLPSLEEFWASLDWSLVPHLGGSGVRMKLLESLASGIPTMATRGAISRIRTELRQHPYLFVSDRPEEWCDRILDGSSQSYRQLFAKMPFPRELDSGRTLSFLSDWS